MCPLVPLPLSSWRTFSDFLSLFFLLLLLAVLLLYFWFHLFGRTAVIFLIRHILVLFDPCHIKFASFNPFSTKSPLLLFSLKKMMSCSLVFVWLESISSWAKTLVCEAFVSKRSCTDLEIYKLRQNVNHTFVGDSRREWIEKRLESFNKPYPFLLGQWFNLTQGNGKWYSKWG